MEKQNKTLQVILEIARILIAVLSGYVGGGGTVNI